jgi:hypothetical protein
MKPTEQGIEQGARECICSRKVFESIHDQRWGAGDVTEAYRSGLHDGYDAAASGASEGAAPRRHWGKDSSY